MAGGGGEAVTLKRPICRRVSAVQGRSCGGGRGRGRSEGEGADGEGADGEGADGEGVDGEGGWVGEKGEGAFRALLWAHGAV